jgi:hypothetical protein
MERPSPHPEFGGHCALAILARRSRAGFFTGVVTVTLSRIDGIGNSVADADKTQPATTTQATSVTL